METHAQIRNMSIIQQLLLIMGWIIYIYNIYISERVFFWDDASNPKRHLWYLGHQNSWDHYRHDHAISKIKTSLNQPEIYVFWSRYSHDIPITSR